MSNNTADILDLKVAFCLRFVRPSFRRHAYVVSVIHVSHNFNPFNSSSPLVVC